MSLSQYGLYRFDEFELDSLKRTLLRGGHPVSLAPKAFDVLSQLVVNPGKVITKEELISAVWAGSFVEEGNLAHHISSLRRAFGDRSGYIVTIPGRGYQFTAEVVRQTPAAAEQCAPNKPPPAAVSVAGVQTIRERTHIVMEETVSQRRGITLSRGIILRVCGGAVAVAAVVLGGVFTWRRFHRPPDSAKVVIADFENRTGDPDFDHVLNQALSIELEQSPFLDILSQSKIEETLTDMRRKNDEAFSPAVAREVCERNNYQAMLRGAIAKVGKTYLVTLSATSCVTGANLASSEQEAADKDTVLQAINRATSQVRRKLGESRASMQRFDKPLFSANTNSLEALRAFNDGDRLALAGKYEEAIPHLQRAVSLDPAFAAAYHDLGSVYRMAADPARWREFISKAYELRDNAEERDKLLIVADYNESVTGDVYESIRNYREWAETYPRSPHPWVGIANLYIYSFGQPELAIDPAKRVVALNDRFSAGHELLARAYLHAGKLAEAQAAVDRGLAKFPDSSSVRRIALELAYIQDDQKAVEAQFAWAKDHPGGSRLKVHEARIAFAEGRVRRGQELMAEMAESFQREGLASSGNYYLGASSRMLAEMGLLKEARNLLDTVPLSQDSIDAYVAMVEAGEEQRAEQAVRQLLADHPKDTLWQSVRGPEVQAAILLAQHKPEEAIAALQAGLPFDLRDFDLPSIRGQAYLDSNQGALAEEEFRKILDHPGVDALSPQYPLAYLGLGRAYALQHKPEMARAAYDHLFDRWKNADPDLPLLIQAKQEYKRLGVAGL